LLDTALLAGDGPAVGDDLHVYGPTARWFRHPLRLSGDSSRRDPR
jgi:hypothetical protein